MYFDYEWVKTYLPKPPALEEAARLLNLTGLEAEIEEAGLEIEHTTNRPDAMNHFGVARELAVKLGQRPTLPPVFEGDIPDLPDWRVETDDPEQCPQYIAVKVDNVTAGPSPQWLVDRLTAIEQTCHNTLVDLTNFLLWEMGHPSHAFDAAKLRGNQIRIRFGDKGERLTTLDGRDHDAADLLCIADAERPIAFAGVMGGENTEVGPDTRELLLELACFNPLAARQTGRQCNIESDARHRFERGVDRERMDFIVRRFLYLLLQEQPDARIIGMIDMNRAPFERTALTLRRARLRQLLGIELPDARVAGLLEAMDCRPQPVDDGWRVAVPGYKVDVTREIDLIEEIIRFAGFDLLNAQLPPMAGSDFQPEPLRDNEEAMRRFLAGLGLQEACSYSFIPEAWDRDFAENDAELVRLRNPMSENQAVMRRRLLPGLLDAARRNLNRGVDDLALFEIGHVFEGMEEPHRLAAISIQSKTKDHWLWSPPVHPFYRVKGLFEALARRFEWRLELRAPAPRGFHPEKALGVYAGEALIGGVGELDPKLMQRWDIEAPLGALELDLGFLQSAAATELASGLISEFPAIQLDMAFVLDAQHDYRVIRDSLLALELENLESLTLFDVYEGKALDAGKKSLGFRFTFRSAERTLTSDETARAMARVEDEIVRRFGASVRR